MEGNYTEMWIADKNSILDCMKKNLVSDLEAGYDPNGNSVRKQQGDIAFYQAEYSAQIEMFKFWEPKKINNWCYWDLKKRGAIA